MYIYLFTILICYLIGSIPTAYIMGKYLKGIDIRNHGSGNVGATNALRVLGKKAGSITLLIDILKGAICVSLIPMLFAEKSNELIRIIACISVIAGHIWTVFLKFKGGKGIATSCGAFLGLTPIPVLITVAIFGVTLACFRYVSLGSITAAFCLPFLIFFMEHSITYTIFSSIIAALLIFKHRANIKRLLNETENKIGKSTAKKPVVY